MRFIALLILIFQFAVIPVSRAHESDMTRVDFTINNTPVGFTEYAMVVRVDVLDLIYGRDYMGAHSRLNIEPERIPETASKLSAQLTTIVDGSRIYFDGEEEELSRVRGISSEEIEHYLHMNNDRTPMPLPFAAQGYVKRGAREFELQLHEDLGEISLSVSNPQYFVLPEQEKSPTFRIASPENQQTTLSQFFDSIEQFDLKNLLLIIAAFAFSLSLFSYFRKTGFKRLSAQ